MNYLDKELIELDREWAGAVSDAVKLVRTLPNALIYPLNEEQTYLARRMPMRQWLDFKAQLSDSLRRGLSLNEFTNDVASMYVDGGLSNKCDLDVLSGIYDDITDRFSTSLAFPYRVEMSRGANVIVFNRYSDLEFIEYAVYNDPIRR